MHAPRSSSACRSAFQEGSRRDIGKQSDGAPPGLEVPRRDVQRSLRVRVAKVVNARNGWRCLAAQRVKREQYTSGPGGVARERMQAHSTARTSGPQTASFVMPDVEQFQPARPARDFMATAPQQGYANEAEAHLQ